MSSASTNGSPTSGAGSATVPLRMKSSNPFSLKFWAKNADRTIVHAVPAAITACSACSAAFSPRPDSSTSRPTPLSAARTAKRRTRSSASGATRSG